MNIRQHCLHSNEKQDSLRLKLRNEKADFERGLSAISEYIQRNTINAKAIYNVELVFEELITNITRYGYSDTATHVIEVAVYLQGTDIVMVFDDDGLAFNPLTVQDPDLPTSIEQARVGGLGLMLVRKSTKKMEYQRIPGHNILKVTIANT
jgi:serine/threonine-protein kinase RsbW